MTTSTYNTVNERLTSFFDNKEDVIENYNKMATVYDSEYDQCGYNGPRYGAEELARLLGENKDARIVDVAAGTGRSSEILKGLGFTNMDAVDGSDNMRVIAMEKDLFKRYIVSMISGDPTPGIDNDSYDGLVTVGSFCPGHIPAETVQEMVRIVKPGGYIVIVMREQWFFEVYDGVIERIFYALMQQGKVRRVSRKIVPKHFGDHDGLLFSYQIIKK